MTGELPSISTISATAASGALSLTLPPTMTIETAETFAAELKQLPLAEKTQLTLDAACVETITTPGLQLVVSLAKTLEAQSGKLTIINPRESFKHAFSDSGLESLLG